MVGVFEERLPGERDLDVAGQRVALAEVAELAELPAKGALVGARHAVGSVRALGRSGPRVLERRAARVVVHEVARAVLREADLPAARQRLLQRAHLLPLRTHTPLSLHPSTYPHTRVAIVSLQLPKRYLLN